SSPIPSADESDSHAAAWEHPVALPESGIGVVGEPTVFVDAQVRQPLPKTGSPLTSGTAGSPGAELRSLIGTMDEPSDEVWQTILAPDSPVRGDRKPGAAHSPRRGTPSKRSTSKVDGASAPLPLAQL